VLKISVVIPTFNSAQYIGAAIESVLAQSIRIHEVCVVDDGSTDHTQQVLAQFGKRIRLFTQHNQGPAAARNRALDEVTGELIIFLDADDSLDSNAAQALTAGYQRALQSKKNVGVVYGDYWLADAAHRYRRRISVARISRGQLIVDPCVIPSGMLISRDCVGTVGKFDPTLNTVEDWDYCLRIAVAGFEFVKIADITCVHLEHAASLSKHEERATAQRLKLLNRWAACSILSDTERGRISREIARTLLRRVRQQIYTHQLDSAEASLAAAIDLDGSLLGDPFLIAYCAVYVGPFYRETMSLPEVVAGIDLAAQTITAVRRRQGKPARSLSAERNLAMSIELLLRHRYIAATIRALGTGVLYPRAVLGSLQTAHHEWTRVRSIRSH